MPTKSRAKYIIDSRGRRVEVLLPIDEYETMIREIENLRDAQYVDEAEASAEGFIELSELRRDLSGEAP